MNILVNVNSICVNSSHAQYECMDCGLDLEHDCDCIWDTTASYIDVRCEACNEIHKDVFIDDLVGHNYFTDEDDDRMNDEYDESWFALTSLPNVSFSIR